MTEPSIFFQGHLEPELLVVWDEFLKDGHRKPRAYKVEMLTLSGHSTEKGVIKLEEVNILSGLDKT